MLRRLTVIAVIIQLAAIVLPPGIPALSKSGSNDNKGAFTNGAAMPLDLAFSMRSLGRENNPALSRDGNLVVFAVHTPPATKPGDASHSTHRLMPNGTPASLVGSRLFITEVATGRTKPLGPDRGNSWRPSWSRDDRMVAFYTDAEGAPQLWVYAVESGQSRKVSDVRIKSKLWTGDEAHWSKDSREVYVPVNLSPETKGEPQQRAKPITGSPAVMIYRSGGEVQAVQADARPDAMREHFERENNSTLAAINVSTGKIRVVVAADAEPRPACLRVSPDGKWVSYLSVFHKKGIQAASNYDLAVVPATGGKVRVIATDLVAPEDDYFGRTYRWHQSSDRVLYFKNGKLWLADITESGEIQSRQLAIEWEQLAADTLALTRDGRSAVVRIARAGDKNPSVKVPALGLVPLDGGKPKVIELAGGLSPRAVVEAAPGLLFQPQPDECIVVAIDPASGERVVARLNVETNETKALLRDRAIIRFVGSGADHRSIVAAFESATTPPNLYRFNHDFSERRRLTTVEPRLDNVSIGAVETFTTSVTRYDGKKVEVTTSMLLPKGAKRGDRLPTVVFIYGGSNYSTLANRFGGGSPATVPALIFLSRGYAMMLPDVPLAPGGSPSNPIKDMTGVLLPQVNRAAELGYSDPDRLAIAGQSYGGYSTASVISETPRFKAAIAISGLYDLGAFYSRLHAGGILNFNWSEKGQGRMGTHPWNDLERYVNNSPYYRADKINTPLLLVHGKNDDTCPLWEAEKMYAALKRFDKTAQLAVYEGEGHVVSEWSPVNAIDAAKRMLEFLEKHLKAGE